MVLKVNTKHSQENSFHEGRSMSLVRRVEGEPGDFALGP